MPAQVEALFFDGYHIAPSANVPNDIKINFHRGESNAQAYCADRSDRDAGVLLK